VSFSRRVRPQEAEKPSPVASPYLMSRSTSLSAKAPRQLVACRAAVSRRRPQIGFNFSRSSVQFPRTLFVATVWLTAWRRQISLLDPAVCVQSQIGPGKGDPGGPYSGCLLRLRSP